MEDRRDEKPWYLTDRARWLAHVYFTRDESIRVRDVSSLDVGVDLLVGPGESREGEDWTMGVVTDGAVSLPEEAEETEEGIHIPRSELDFPALSTLPDIPVLLAYYTMSDDQGYGALFLNGVPASWSGWTKVEGQSLGFTGRSANLPPFFRLDETAYRLLIDPEFQQTLSQLADRGASESSSGERSLVTGI
jgi:hypothetical protein